MKAIRTNTSAILAAALLALLPACKPTREAPKPVAVIPPAPGATGGAFTGHRAITPVGSNLITEAQVREYVGSHRVPGTLQASNASITSVKFLSSQQVRTLLHSANLGLSDDAPLCLVLLSGKFVFSGPPGQTPTFPVGDEVFDARTGNLLQWGGLPTAPSMENQEHPPR